MTHAPYLTKLPYGNCTMLSPQGVMLCRCDLKKANWYLKRGLAEVVEADPLIFRLKFQPKGNGHAEYPYYIATKENICVCCGAKDRLTKHHCVPRCFRKFFPEEYKDHSCHDIVVTCIECHRKYEPHADQLKRDLASQYHVPRHIPLTKEQISTSYMLRLGRALLQHRDKMPAARIQELEKRLKDFWGKTEITEEDLQLCYTRLQSYKKTQSEEDSYGRHIADRVADIPKFVRMWRQHFVSTMHPQFLPEFWSVDHCEPANPVPTKLLNLGETLENYTSQSQQS